VRRFFFPLRCPCPEQGPFHSTFKPTTKTPCKLQITNYEVRTRSTLRCTRGAGKNKFDGPPRTFAKSQTHPPTIRLFFLDFFFSTFLGVSRQGEFKNTIKIYFYKKSMSKINSKISTKISMSVFSRLFCLIAFSGVFQRREFKAKRKTLQKTFYKKNRVEKFLQKIRPKSRFWFLTFDFFSIFFLSRFWFLGVSRWGEFKNTIFFRTKKKIWPQTPVPSPFSYSDPPTHHGGRRFFFVGPLPCRLQVEVDAPLRAPCSLLHAPCSLLLFFGI
jgi:hypothetical protein